MSLFPERLHHHAWSRFRLGEPLGVHNFELQLEFAVAQGAGGAAIVVGRYTLRRGRIGSISVAKRKCRAERRDDAEY